MNITPVNNFSVARQNYNTNKKQPVFTSNVVVTDEIKHNMKEFASMEAVLAFKNFKEQLQNDGKNNIIRINSYDMISLEKSFYITVYGDYYNDIDFDFFNPNPFINDNAADSDSISYENANIENLNENLKQVYQRIEDKRVKLENEESLKTKKAEEEKIRQKEIDDL
ncbi:MAG TPA: hypothetical protein PLG15_04910 [Candidatus Gastranaerophilaceae bacterium]|nr:hypothetical protein [Candidatus Gastranaerophilaceae bacterium]